MSRITLFAKGNLDVRDSLHALRLGGTVAWNGVNAVLRERAPGVTARVRHETFVRSDALLAATGRPPAAVAERALDLGAYPAASQFSRALFEAEADAYVLSIQPDLNTVVARHREEGFLFYPNDFGRWPAGEQAWLKSAFTNAGLLTVEDSMANFEAVIAALRARSAAPILIYNVSAVVPGEQVHDHSGLEGLFSTRIRRFNLALAELSQRTGVSIIDVDAVVARGGADRMKLDTVHLTAEGCQAVAEEVVRVLEDLGVVPAAEARACA